MLYPSASCLSGLQFGSAEFTVAAFMAAPDSTQSRVSFVASFT